LANVPTAGTSLIETSKLRTSILRPTRRRGLPIEDAGDLVAGVAAVEAKSGRLLGILEFITGVEEIFDLQVLPDIRRGEILAPRQWFEPPSIVTIKAACGKLAIGMKKRREPTRRLIETSKRASSEMMLLFRRRHFRAAQSDCDHQIPVTVCLMPLARSKRAP
jgi:hypothetical protein